jgi:hypothetical protein
MRCSGSLIFLLYFLHGAGALPPLRAALVEAKGFVDRTTLPDGTAIFSGIAIDVFEAALDQICDVSPSSCWAKREVVYYTVSEYGANTSSGVWTGAIGELQAGRAEVAVGDINENLQRSRVVDFTGSWLDAPLAFLASPVTPVARANLWGWLRPFSSDVWLSLLAMTALFAVSLAWLERYSPFSFRNLPPVRGREELRQRVNMKDTWHRAVNALLGQGPWGIDLSSHSARLIWWAMAFLSMFTTTFYTSSLTSQLSAAVPYTPINSLADIQSGQIPFCVQANSSAQAFIANPANAVAIRRMANYMAVAPTLEGCLGKLLDDADPVRAVMAEAPILAIVSAAPPYCGPVVVGTLVAQGYYSFPVRRGHPLAAQLTDAVLANMESLVTGDIVGRYTREGGGGGGCAGGGGEDSGAPPPAIGIADFGGVFLATLAIVGASWVLLACEVVVWRRRARGGRLQRACFKFCGGHDFKEAYEREDASADAEYLAAAAAVAEAPKQQQQQQQQRRGGVATALEWPPTGSSDRAAPAGTRSTASGDAENFSSANPINS